MKHLFRARNIMLNKRFSGNLSGRSERLFREIGTKNPYFDPFSKGLSLSLLRLLKGERRY